MDKLHSTRQDFQFVSERKRKSFCEFISNTRGMYKMEKKYVEKRIILIILN
jgi:hypothetical protein